MQIEKKVVAAIASALDLYMQAEQEALMALQQKKLAGTQGPAYSPWGLSGRKAMMDARWLWQMRLVR